MKSNFISLMAFGHAVWAQASPRQYCANVTLPSSQEFELLTVQGAEASGSGASFCNVTVTLTHTGESDLVIATIFLPFDNWNGRFIVLGGGGLSAEASSSAMASQAAQGWAVGATDAGLSRGRTISASSGQWVLRDGQIDWSSVTNFAHRAVHDTTTLAKAAIKRAYGEDVRHSYYSGCSTGGRQGYFAAQYHPGDFDGILANAPAIHTPRVSPGTFWPSVVMGNIVAPPQCVFTAYFDAIVQHCDPLDGVRDGLISAPAKCKFDTRSLVGTVIACSGTNVTITAEHATVVSKSLEGARSPAGDHLYYGIPPGASFTGQANTRTTNGVTVAVPFGSGETWMRYFVAQDPTLDTASLTFEEFDVLFQRSVDLYTEILGTTNPNLAEFRAAGGKLLTWHGLSDPLITHEGTLEYWRNLRRTMGRGTQLEDFYRVFFAPGAGHCSGGYGPVPVNPLAVLVDWVENKTAPATLFAQATVNGRTITRNLCLYPSSLRYDGTGDVNSAASFNCKSCVPRA